MVIEVLGIDPEAGTEGKILDAAFTVLGEKGRVSMNLLRKRLHWGGHRWARLKKSFDYWNMASWENGAEPSSEEG